MASAVPIVTAVVSSRIVARAATEQPEGEDAAELARLRYVADDTPGITRVTRGRRTVYLEADGRSVRKRRTLDRIAALVIPPAWTRVWICPREDGHVQSTGRDTRGRKQYRYHPRWQQVRDAAKYGKLLAFGRSLSALRRAVDRDLRAPTLSRARVLATVVRLLETTRIRVGNEEYARSNQSFGLTTLRDRHVVVSAGRVRFRFHAKSGVWHELELRDAQLARTVKRCQDLPGQVLFQYLDAEGATQRVTSEDVNDYLREVTGQPFTAKDFRTWSGTVLAANALRALEHEETAAGRKRNITKAVDEVARQLGNTRAVCRRCYIHPVLFERYLDGAVPDWLRPPARATRTRQLSPEETVVLALLQRHMTHARHSACGRRPS